MTTLKPTECLICHQYIGRKNQRTLELSSGQRLHFHADCWDSATEAVRNMLKDLERMQKEAPPGPYTVKVSPLRLHNVGPCAMCGEPATHMFRSVVSATGEVVDTQLICVSHATLVMDSIAQEIGGV